MLRNMAAAKKTGAAVGCMLLVACARSRASFYWGKRGSYAGSRKSSATAGSGNAYYEGGNDGSDAHRATPSERNSGRANWVGVDGHAETATLRQLDGQGTSPNSLPNNAWWNGRFDPTVR